MAAEKTEHASLAAALTAFQAALPHIGKDNTAQVRSEKGNYSYKYADLSDVSAAVLPALARHDLSFSAKPTLDEDGKFVLAYVLRHTSGESDAGSWPLPTSGTPQAIGSVITYARRYVLCAVSGVSPDEDDDGQAAASAPYSHDRPARPRPDADPASQGDVPPGEHPAVTARRALATSCTEHGYDLGRVAERFATQYGEPLGEATDPHRIVAFTRLLSGVPQAELVAVNGARQ